MAKNRIAPRQILLNEPLPWDVFDENGTLLLCRGYMITRESQRRVLIARGLYAEEALLKAFRPAPDNRPPVEQQGSNPFRLWDSVIDELEVLLRDIRLIGDFRAQIEGLANLIQDLTQRSPDTSLAAIILTDQRRYPIIHSIHVAVLAELVGSRLSWIIDRRVSLICAAMTQNLGMIDLQMRLCTQRMAPSLPQREEIQRHPKLGHEMLVAAGVKDPLWLRTVLEHHEQVGGGGYPYGITTPCEEALLIQTADIFAAKVSPRAARKPITPQDAARSLYLDSGGGEKNPYVAVLIKEIGIFPPGTLVRLANGETGMVTRRGANANTPEVVSLFSPHGLPYAERQIRQTSHKGNEVVGVIPRDQIKAEINVNRIWRDV